MEVPFGYCHCGCKQKTNLATRTVPHLGFVKGQPMCYLLGHGRATMPVGSTVPPNPSGLCQCGCKKVTPLATYTSHQTGNVKGEHKRFCVGHGHSYCYQVVPENPSGLCMCGCGEKTRISPLTRAERGYAAGQPENFIHNHHGKQSRDYLEEDRGWTTPCWIWQKGCDKDGYATATIDGRRVRVHRHYYENFKGKIRRGCDVHHLCHIHACINPDHHEAVTKVEHARLGPNVKLTMAKARKARRLSKAGLSYGEIAKKFGVSRMSICKLVLGVTWKDKGVVYSKPPLRK